jgi:hypothetical protein
MNLTRHRNEFQRRLRQGERREDEQNQPSALKVHGYNGKSTEANPARMSSALKNRKKHQSQAVHGRILCFLCE